jgi:hypothetical protein
MSRSLCIVAALIFPALLLQADVLPATTGQMYDLRQNSNLFWNNWSVNVTITGISYHTGSASSASTQAGIFNLLWESGPGVDGQTGISNNKLVNYSSFRAVCFDPFEILWSNADTPIGDNGEADNELTHYVGTLEAYPNPPDSKPGQTNYVTLSDQKKDDLRRLYNLAFDHVDTQAEAAAFQVAVWEIVGETSSTYNVLKNSGTFYTNWTTATGGVSTAAANQANQWLNNLSSATPVELLAWSPVFKGVDSVWRRAVGQELLTPTPEPQYYGLLAAGMTGVFVLARRRRVRQS